MILLKSLIVLFIFLILCHFQKKLYEKDAKEGFEELQQKELQKKELQMKELNSKLQELLKLSDQAKIINENLSSMKN
jgi:hypothetical protein